jgi:hypothetical protein
VEVEQPGKEPLDFPASFVAAQRATVLRRYPAVLFVGCNHLRAVLLQELLIQPVAVISLVSDQAFRHAIF